MSVLDSAASRPLLPSRAREIPVARKPEWIRTRLPSGETHLRVKTILKQRGLSTVCEEAKCPNLAECWNSGTATFMLGTEVCTRACRFCAVKTARRPPALDPAEPELVAESVAELKLKYVVLTSVDRDDLEDGGAEHFAKTIAAIKKLNSEIVVEALVPDFRGRLESVRTIIDSGVDVYAHNVETVRRLQYRVRDPRANFDQSIGTLVEATRYAEETGRTVYSKSGIMLGLGETREELNAALVELRARGVSVITLGQYLRPTQSHLPVERFVPPEEFKEIQNEAQGMGFLYVAAGPMVRSSYRAAELFIHGLFNKKEVTLEKGADHAI